MYTDDTYLMAMQAKAASMTKGYAMAWRVRPGLAVITADFVPGDETDLAEWERDLLDLPAVREVGSVMWDGDGGVYAVITVPGAARIVACNDVTDAIRALAKVAVDMRFGRF